MSIKYEALVLDTETTGKDNPEPIEVAYKPITSAGDDADFFCKRYLPTGDISFGAMATHNILLEDLKDCGPFSEFQLPECKYLIGHNISYDWSVIGKPAVKLIDTLALSRIVWPDSDSHTQMACLYRMDRHVAQKLAHGAHGARADVEMNVMLFNHLSSTIGCRNAPDEFEFLCDLTDKASVPLNFPVGKYYGKPIVGTDASYNQWFMKQPDVDPFFMRALKGEVPPTLETAQAWANALRVAAELKTPQGDFTMDDLLKLSDTELSFKIGELSRDDLGAVADELNIQFDKHTTSDDLRAAVLSKFEQIKMSPVVHGVHG